MTRLIAISLAIQTCQVACTAVPKAARFEEAADVLAGIPPGTDLRRIEKELSLPQPSKTFAGSSLYDGRIFRYERSDGLFLEIGLDQTSPEADYRKGHFAYRGHHTLSVGRWIWKRWLWNDIGLIEVRGEREEGTCRCCGRKP